MRDPALVLGAHLPRAVDAAHAEHAASAGRSCGRSRARTGRPRPWSSRRACGNRAAGSRRCRARAIAGSSARSGRRSVVERRCRRDRRRPCWSRRRSPARGSPRARTASSRLIVPRDVDLEILARVDEAGRHRHLRGHVEHRLAPRAAARTSSSSSRTSPTIVRDPLAVALASARRGCAPRRAATARRRR